MKWDFRDLEAGLKALREETSTATIKNAVRRGLTKAAQPMADRAQQLVHKRSKKLSNSIVVGQLKKKVGDAEYAAVLAAGGAKADAVKAMRDARRAAKGSGPVAVIVHVGPGGPEGSRAHLEEFGVKPHIIKPKTKGGQLSWPGEGGGRVFAGAEIRHPGHAPHPFMRPAFEETSDQVLAAMVPMIQFEMGVAMARAARRRSRKAAKG